jgi:hypothetical protein
LSHARRFIVSFSFSLAVSVSFSIWHCPHCIPQYALLSPLWTHIRPFLSRSYIRGTNGNSNGLVPMLRVFNDTARYVDQGGGKRKGAFAIYLEPWHADIFDFLDMRKNHGKEVRV